VAEDETSGDKDTMGLRCSQLGEDGDPTARGTTMHPAPSLACLQQMALDEGGNEVVGGVVEPRGDGRAWLVWLSKAGSMRGTQSLPTPNHTPSANWPKSISKHIFQLRPGKNRVWPFFLALTLISFTKVDTTRGGRGWLSSPLRETGWVSCCPLVYLYF